MIGLNMKMRIWSSQRPGASMSVKNAIISFFGELERYKSL